MPVPFPFKSSKIASSKAAESECSEIELLISLYSDGMTSAVETRRVDAHLAECESCKKAHFWMRATCDVLSNRPAVLPPSDMANRIRRAIAEADAAQPAVQTVPAIVKQPIRLRFNLRPVYGMAATVLLAALLFGPLHLFRQSPSVNQPSNGLTVASQTPGAPLPNTATTLPTPPDTSQIPETVSTLVKPHAGQTQVAQSTVKSVVTPRAMNHAVMAADRITLRSGHPEPIINMASTHAVDVHTTDRVHAPIIAPSPIVRQPSTIVATLPPVTSPHTTPAPSPPAPPVLLPEPTHQDAIVAAAHTPEPEVTAPAVPDPAPSTKVADAGRDIMANIGTHFADSRHEWTSHTHPIAFVHDSNSLSIVGMAR